MKALWLALAVAVVTVLRAQSAPPQAPALPELKGISEAEAEGQRFPRATSQSNLDLSRRFAVPGSPDRKCADVGSSETVRSGEFVAGNFAMYPTIYRLGSGKIWWQPAHWPELMADGWPPKGDMPLTVRATRLDASSPSRTYNYASWAKPSDSNGKILAEELFVPTGLRLPTPGRWILVATLGPNWGCFVYTLPE